MFSFTLVDFLNICIGVSGLTIAILGLLSVILIHQIDLWEKNFLTVFFAVLILYCASDFTSQISLVLLGEDFTFLSKTAIFLESLFSSFLMPMLTIYLLHKCGESYRCLLMYFVSFCWLIYFSLLLITQFTSYIYYFTDDNFYHRGAYYPLLLIPPVLLMLTNLVALYRRKSLLSTSSVLSFTLYIIIPTVFMLIQMKTYGVLLVALGTAISSMVLYINILNEQIQREVRQATELTEKTLLVRSMQIRPHFIYNTLSNIYYLAEIDSKKAQKTIYDFLTYLKQSFSAMETTGMIPFEDELKHVKSFLSVVKVRYEDLIFVDYDIRHTAFRIPPLTVENLVENSVKHGLDPEQGPLHIMIRTSSNEKGSIITIEDTGTGTVSTEEQKQNDAPHIGLSNTRERLRILCNGTISVDDREGGGTIVTIRVPDHDNNPSIPS